MCFHVPASHLDAVKSALFEAGAGKVGDYDSCCWQVLGQGQFRPLAGSQPYLGQQGRLEAVAEYRVEMVCSDECIRAAVKALKLAHPYEEPAYDVMKVEEF
nr:NGG1p interacting factor NIF3 [Aestuariicella hydrocarbonica]